MSNVKLAIRVRPFTERELKSEKDRIPVVNVLNDNAVTITNMKVSMSGAGDSRERVRRYFADYTFNSACAATNPAYASQEKVFESIGREVISSVIGGLSACVLAYGQSATGKTYTMMGSDSQPGLIPKICRTLAENQQTEVTVSFLEIYNEKVHDLLAGEEAPATCHSLPRRRGNARKDLRVREHPTKGPYVQNLRRVAVHDVTALLALVSEGSRRRRTAATKRNLTSSRSHALLELSTPTATLHLADLAGSEKASWEGCSGGGRQKEGANINKSLVALSNVISALVSRGRGRFVPYRDSALTWLLKDCFTGGASTFIIATVSPSVACYGESASTLRWAERARQLPTPRIVNVGSQNSRAALQSQFNQLIAELARNYIRYVPESGTIVYDDKHWIIIQNENAQVTSGVNKEPKIGNIMNTLRQKTDAPNSETTASSNASGSSDVINKMEKNYNITNEVNKEIDKLFGPSLERTKSGSDLKVIAPLRFKKRQFRSQEVLPIDESTNAPHCPTLINSLDSVSTNSNKNELYDIGQSRNRDQVTGNTNISQHIQIPIFYDNQRAEIVASVTERLYSKLKKKEEAAVSKMESVVDRKIMEPLSELRICSNARQRLIELSQKAVRHKRKIGIPAYTQTRKTVVRVKDQGTNVQSDIESYFVKEKNLYVHRHDASTETLPTTPRYKDIAVGPKYGSVNFHDKSTTTENREKVQRNCFVMTEDLPRCHRSVQTHVVPPPRRKKRTSTISKQKDTKENYSEECLSVPVISINISQTYSLESESQSSDDNLCKQVNNSSKINTTMTPDLLTNHSTLDTTNEAKELETSEDKLMIARNSQVSSQLQRNSSEEFPDTEDHILPRVTISPSAKMNHDDMRNIIMGRNRNVYPYNIVLSPQRERDDTKKMVKFKNIDQVSSASEAIHNDREKDSIACLKLDASCNINFSKEDNDKDLQVSTFSDSTDSCGKDSDLFIWKRGLSNHNNIVNSLSKRYIPVHNSKYKTAKDNFYRELLESDGKNKNPKIKQCLSQKETASSDSADFYDVSESIFKQKRKYFTQRRSTVTVEDDTFEDIERNILYSCDKLDMSVYKYEDYLANCSNINNYWNKESIRSPTEYLKHLIQLRREAVKADSDTDCSLSISRK